MPAGRLLLALLLQVPAWPPEWLAYVAAHEVGAPEIGSALAAICQRESNCERIGAHPIDAHLSRRGWRSQVRLGHLDPECQPYEPGAWATRGPWGLSAASHWQFLPPCYSPADLDDPLVSARVAARKYLARCRGARRGWCHGSTASRPALEAWGEVGALAIGG